MGQCALHGVWHKDWRSEAALDVESVCDSGASKTSELRRRA